MRTEGANRTLPTTDKTEDTEMASKSRARYAQDRVGWLLVMPSAEVFEYNELGERTLTDYGSSICELLSDEMEEFDPEWLERLVYSDHEAYVVKFERDLDFFADRHASFGWICSFVPVVSIPALNRRGLNVAFAWRTSSPF